MSYLGRSSINGSKFYFTLYPQFSVVSTDGFDVSYFCQFFSRAWFSKIRAFQTSVVNRGDSWGVLRENIRIVGVVTLMCGLLCFLCVHQYSLSGVNARMMGYYTRIHSDSALVDKYTGM